MTQEQFDKVLKLAARRGSGASSNTSLWLEDAQKAWLKKVFGGIQPGIKELVEAAMTGTKPRLEKVRRRRPRRVPTDKAQE